MRKSGTGFSNKLAHRCATAYREALAGRRATLGDTHADTRESISNLGMLLKAQGDLAGAAPLLREALAGYRATLSDTHPDTLTSINNLGGLLHAQGDLAGAAQLFRDALAGRVATLGVKHPHTRISIDNLRGLLCDMLHAQGDLAGTERSWLLREIQALDTSTTTWIVFTWIQILLVLVQALQ